VQRTHAERNGYGRQLAGAALFRFLRRLVRIRAEFHVHPAVRRIWRRHLARHSPADDRIRLALGVRPIAARTGIECRGADLEDELHGPCAANRRRLPADRGRTILRAGAGRYFDADFGAAVDGINGAPFNTWQFNNGATNPSSIRNAPIPIAYGFAPDLRVPSTWGWNVTLERSLNPERYAVGGLGKLRVQRFAAPGSEPGQQHGHGNGGGHQPRLVPLRCAAGAVSQAAGAALAGAGFL